MSGAESMTVKQDIYGVLIVGAILALIVYGAAWYSKPANVPAGMTVEATQAKEVAKEETAPLNIDFVKVFKPEVKAKLKLPSEVVKDPAQHVISSSKTRGDEHPHTITTTVNSATGEFTTYDRTDSLPWVSVSTKTEVGLYYGLKNGEQAIRLEGKQELLQIKAIHVGATASLDSTRDGTEGFVGVGAWARW